MGRPGEKSANLYHPLMALFSTPASAPQPIPVSALAMMIAEAVATGLPQKIQVRGEISNFSNRRHWYFTLKDAEAQVKAVMWESKARGVAFPMKDGLAVVATGRVEFWPQGGSVQFYVDSLEPAGVGALEQELRRRMAEYLAKGYFDAQTKKPLPEVPRAVAVVTSRSAAALQDVIATAKKRWAGCRLFLVDVRVQGEGAKEEIARALNALSEQGAALGIDAVILTRGGGSIEDLWAFNEPEVVEAVHTCSLPVVAAIGHETDTTLAELAADWRASTPTQAVMTLIPDRDSLRQRYAQNGERLRLFAERALHDGRRRLVGVARHPMFKDPQGALVPARRKLEALASRPFFIRPQQIIAPRRQGLDALSKRLSALSPQSTLSRGYSYTTLADGTLVRSVAAAVPGAGLVTHLADGQVVSRVAGEDSGPPPAPKVAPRRKKAPVQDGAGLFG